jgi:hypothetical protein
MNPEHTPRHGREQPHAVTLLPVLLPDLARRQQLCARALELERTHLERGDGRRERGACSPMGALRLIEVALRDRVLTDKVACASELGTCKVEFRLCHLDLGSGERLSGFGSPNVCSRLRFAARVEERWIDRLDLGDDGLEARHGIADVRVDALHVTGDRRGQRIDVVDARLPLVVDRDYEPAPFDLPEFDDYGARPE